MSQEKVLFEKCIARVNAYLKVNGAQFIPENRGKSFLARLRHRRFLYFALIWFQIDVVAAIAWFIKAIVIGTKLVELTYSAPCITQCMLATVKIYYFLKNEDHVYDLLSSLYTLQSITASKVRGDVETELKTRVTFLTRATISQFWINVLGVVGFGALPIVILAQNYLSTGEIVLILPFLLLFPFDVYNIRIWPFMYLRVMWTTVIVVMIILGVDALYYACCTFIQIQFRLLQYDFENFFEAKSTIIYERVTNNNDIIAFVTLVKRHQEIIRCTRLMKNIYTKSTLFNVVTSSFLICLTGFNVTAIDYLPMMVPFVAFLFLVLVQIFLFCYFGDILMRSSMEVGDAVYSSQWYNEDAKVMKDFYMVLLRAQKPCKITAYGFSDINLRTFTRILSTSWSYFALLSTVNRN